MTFPCVCACEMNELSRKGKNTSIDTPFSIGAIGLKQKCTQLLTTLFCSNSLFMCQDEDKNETKTESFRSF